MTTITTLPYTISTPGYYDFASDLTSTNSNFVAISIQANNVVLNLNSHVLSNNGAGTATISTGIYIPSGYSNIEITNGMVEKFMYGIRAYDSSGTFTNTKSVVIHNMALYQNTFRAIKADGSDMHVHDNNIADTGPTTFYNNAFVFGIEFYGPGALIENNHIFNTVTTGTGEVVGISASGVNEGAMVQNNVISNKAVANGSYGVWVGGSGGLGVDHNKVEHFDKGIYASTVPTGFYAYNEAFDCTVKYDILSANFLDYGNNL